jgi:hypothetical protein
VDPVVDPDRALAALGKITTVYAQPNWDARKLGYLRAGAVVRRETEPVTTRACRAGWYRIEPEGYVCASGDATLDVNHPIVHASRLRPDRDAPLPYVYGMSRFPAPPFYVKLPTPTEQANTELDLRNHQRTASTREWNVPLGDVPPLFVDGKQSPTLRRFERDLPGITTGFAMPKSGFAFLSFFEAEQRVWGMSVDLELMPLDRVRPVAVSAFHGLALDAETTLPLVFVRARNAYVYTGTPGKLVAGRPLEFREAVPVTGKRVNSKGIEFLETRDGSYLRNENLVYVDRFRRRPGWVAPGRTWIDISILDQTLVAYEGDVPVYATLVSTGVDGLGDPKKSHSTVRGQFLVHTKHVTTSMTGEQVGDEYDLRDVPYVQYFHEGYALHAVYWHDGFGQPRSHGCINLAPLDARWLFEWTEPQVPEAWHGAMSATEGTLVYVHP